MTALNPSSPIALPAVVRDLDSLGAPQPGSGPDQGAGSFSDALGQAMRSVEALQAEADRGAEAVALGGGNLHETALALEKADIGLRVAVKVRNKLVDAYQEVMRMSV